MKKDKALFVCVFLWALLFAGCPNIFDPPDKSEARAPLPAGLGRVIIRLEDSAPRTAFPSGAFTRYVVSFSSGDYSHEALSLNDDEGTVDLEPGVWTISVTAYSGPGGNIPSGTGSAGVTVSAGMSTPVRIVIAPMAGTVKGNLKYTLTYPTGTYSAKTLTITDSAGVQIGSPHTLTDSGTEGTAALDPGSYIAHFVLENSTKRIRAGWSIAVHVYAGEDTPVSHTFTTADFEALIPISGTVSLTINLPEGMTVTAGSTKILAYSDSACTTLVPGAEGLAGSEGAYLLFVPATMTAVYLRPQFAAEGVTIPGAPAALSIPANQSAGITGQNLSAIFYSITVDSAVSGGALDVPPAAVADSTVTVTVTPYAGYTLTEGSVTLNPGGALSPSGGVYSFTLTGNVTVTAEFTRTGFDFSDSGGLVALEDYLQDLPGNTAADPYPVVITGLDTTNSTAMSALSSAISTAGKYVNLDLGDCDGPATLSNPNELKTLVTGNSYVKGLVIPEDVTSIGYSAFSSCTGLTSVIIPAGVTSIGDSAFSSCTGLTSVTIPAGVISIGDFAFRGCNELTSVTIPASVTSIGISPFSASNLPSSASNLAAINVDSANDSYISVDGVLFNKAKTTLVEYPPGKSGSSYTIPSSVTSIGYYAFSGCTGLTSVTIAAGVTSIGTSTFWECTGLTSVTIPAGITSIGGGAFYSCIGLASVAFQGAAPPSIATWTFSGCSSLSAIYVPVGSLAAYKSALNGSGISSLSIIREAIDVSGGDLSALTTYLGTLSSNDVSTPHTVPLAGLDTTNSTAMSALSSAISSAGKYVNLDLSGCNGPATLSSANELKTLATGNSYVKGLSIPEGVTTIDTYAFDSCAGLTSVTIPNTVLTIGAYAFIDCGGLTSVSIPAGVTSIGTCAFSECTGLISVTIPAGVITIGNEAFNECSDLISVTIPASVTSIGNYVFNDCTDLTSVIFQGAAPPNIIGTTIFDDCSSLSAIYVPTGSVSAYQSALSGSGINTSIIQTSP